MLALGTTSVTAVYDLATLRSKEYGLDTCEVLSLSIATPENQRMVRAYVATLSRDVHAVDDLAQEVFVRALERIDRLNDPTNPGPFLRGIARHVVQEHFRQRQRDPSYLDATIDAMADDGECVWRKLQERELSERLKEAIDKLPVVARRMLEMRYHDSRTAAEIAEAFGIRPGTVRVTLLRIRERLRKRLGSD
jgi:RNA polymerase sigma-70 factor (ECF subfamily)